MLDIRRLLEDTNSVDDGHLPAILRQHTLTEWASGSVFTVAAVMEQLSDRSSEFRQLSSKEEAEAGDAIQPDCQYYVLDNIDGLLGVYPISPDENGLVITRDKINCPLTLQGTGTRTIRTDCLTMIVGQHESKTIIFTFFPGPPIKPSSLQVEDLSERHQELFAARGHVEVTYEEAIDYGFSVAKCHGHS